MDYHPQFYRNPTILQNNKKKPYLTLNLLNKMKTSCPMKLKD